MTTTSAGGKITGFIALTFSTDEVLAEGDPVHVVGDYEVAKADGTKAIVGYVSVPSYTRGPSGLTAAAGQVTVEAIGFSVMTVNSGAAIAAGAEVGVGAAKKYVTSAASTARIGVALTAASGASQKIDVLVQGGAVVPSA